MSRVGILLRNNLDNNTFAIDKKDWTFSVKLGKYRTTYMYWKDIKSIQVGNKKVTSPNLEHIPLRISNASFHPPSVIAYLDSDNITDIFKAACIKYNSSLADIIMPIIDSWDYTNGEGTSKMDWWLALKISAGLIMVLQTIAIVCLHTRLTILQANVTRTSKIHKLNKINRKLIINDESDKEFRNSI